MSQPSWIRMWVSLPFFVAAKVFCGIANVVLGTPAYAAFIAGPKGFAGYLEQIHRQTGQEWRAVRADVMGPLP